MRILVSCGGVQKSGQDNNRLGDSQEETESGLHKSSARYH
jgi:hypothetical protein